MELFIEAFDKLPLFKGALILFSMISIFAVYILATNPAAENNTTHICTMLGATLLVIISVVPYLKPDVKNQFSTFVFFRDTEDDKLVTGGWHDPYYHAYGEAFRGIEGHGTTPDKMSFSVPQDAEMEVIEQAIVLKLLRDFSGGNWDADLINIHPVYDGAGNYPGTISLGTGTPYETIEANKLKTLFSDNRYLRSTDLFDQLKFTLPPKTTIEKLPTPNNPDSITPKNLGSGIVMENSDFKITIIISGYQDSGTHGVWGIFKGDSIKSDAPRESAEIINRKLNRYRLHKYTILVRGETKLGKRYTTLTSSYWKWYDKVTNSIKSFDWETIDKAIVEKQTRDALWKDDGALH